MTATQIEAGNKTRKMTKVGINPNKPWFKASFDLAQKVRPEDQLGMIGISEEMTGDVPRFIYFQINGNANTLVVVEMSAFEVGA